ncbi:MAG: hypothetical protein H9535_03640 [Ignavibacteria bacterium]|nr:hypothetical protein [Ignavibacteria bacterium]
MATKKSTYDEVFDTESEQIAQVEETEALAPLDAVTSDGREKETELSASPVLISKERLNAIEDSLQKLEAMESGIALNAKYREFDATGETVRGVYLGMKTIFKKDNGEMKPIECASWIDSTKQVWICGAKILVSQCSELPQGTPVEITYTEKVKVDMGFAKSFDVRPLY